ncbi:MAG: serine/threonine-protein kinase [Gemmataceae bacterium]
MSQAFVLQPGMEPFPGYTLHLPLGRGGNGEVWEAQRNDGTPVAFKFMRCRNSTAATKEVRSIQSLRKLDHPGLLPIYDVLLQPGYIVIAMELAEGTLHDVLDAYVAEYGEALEPELALHYLQPAAEALDFLNARRHVHESRTVGFQHCDIKPSNLLIVGESVKLADYGLATPMSGPLEPHGRAGTLDFAAPEVFRGQLSERTDQYALAVTYCLLRGNRLPFANTPGRFTPSYSRGRPDLSMLTPAEQLAIAKALSVAPVHRFPSCAAMLQALRANLVPASGGSKPRASQR